MTREGTKAVNNEVVNTKDVEVEAGRDDAVSVGGHELSRPDVQADQGLADLSQLNVPSVFGAGRVVQEEALGDVLKFAVGAEVEGESVTPEKLVVSEMYLGVVRAEKDGFIDRGGKVTPVALLEDNPFGSSLDAIEAVENIREQVASFMRHNLGGKGLSPTEAVSIQGEDGFLPEAEQGLGVIKRLKEEAGELGGDPALLLRKAA